VRAHTSRLWPYSHITAAVRVLNGGRAGKLSDTVEFNTPEGRTHFISVYFIALLLHNAFHSADYTVAGFLTIFVSICHSSMQC